jgi:sarcosine oxidase
MTSEALDLTGAFDVVVLGLGAVGSFALRELSGRGLRVLGIDAHGPAHALGSSHGHTRVFRHAYFEHPDYVPLLRVATAGFEHLERATGTPLLARVGVLVVGPSDSVAVAGCRHAAQVHGLAVESLSGPQLKARFPQFAVSGTTEAVLEPDAGFVRVERAISAAVEDASAPRLHHTRVRSWTRVGTDSIDVLLEDGRVVRTRRLAIAAGAWTPVLVPELASLLTVTRQVQTWVTPDIEGAADPSRLPAWLVDRPGDRHLYGIPTDPLRGGPALAKVAVHGSDQVTTGDAVERAITDADRDRVARAIPSVVPGLAGPIADASVCLYTTTPDEHFLVDRLPGTPEVAVVAGLSGHGFKLAPALGRALADLCVDGRTDLPVGFLGLSRFR